MGVRLFLSLLLLSWCVLPPAVSAPVGAARAMAAAAPAVDGTPPTDGAGRPLLADTLGSDILPVALALRHVPARGEQKATGSDPRPNVSTIAHSVGCTAFQATVSRWRHASAPPVDPGILEGCRIPTGPPFPMAS